MAILQKTSEKTFRLENDVEQLRQMVAEKDEMLSLLEFQKSILVKSVRQSFLLIKTTIKFRLLEKSPPLIFVLFCSHTLEK